VAQAFSTLGGSDTDAIKNEKLKEFVNSFGLDMQDLLAAADDGDGSLDLGEFKEMLLEKPTQDWLPDKKFQPGSMTRSQNQTWASQDPDAKSAKKKKEAVVKVEKAAPGMQKGEEEDDELTKIRRARKRFDFMESLSKQYKADKLAATKTSGSQNKSRIS